jgi:hypothetical protein
VKYGRACPQRLVQAHRAIGARKTAPPVSSLSPLRCSAPLDSRSFHVFPIKSVLNVNVFKVENKLEKLDSSVQFDMLLIKHSSLSHELLNCVQLNSTITFFSILFKEKGYSQRKLPSFHFCGHLFYTWL